MVRLLVPGEDVSSGTGSRGFLNVLLVTCRCILRWRSWVILVLSTFTEQRKRIQKNREGSRIAEDLGRYHAKSFQTGL